MLRGVRFTPSAYASCNDAERARETHSLKPEMLDEAFGVRACFEGRNEILRMATTAPIVNLLTSKGPNNAFSAITSWTKQPAISQWQHLLPQTVS